MIKDRIIDLTQERKFGLQSVTRRLILFGEIIFPWQMRPIETCKNTKTFRERIDRFSSECGELIRRTSNNSWFFGNSQIYETESIPQRVMKELLFEMGLCFENSALKWNRSKCCPRCGRQTVWAMGVELCKCCKESMGQEDIHKKLFPKIQKSSFCSWMDCPISTRGGGRHFIYPQTITQELINS